MGLQQDQHGDAEHTADGGVAADGHQGQLIIRVAAGGIGGQQPQYLAPGADFLQDLAQIRVSSQWWRLIAVGALCAISFFAGQASGALPKAMHVSPTDVLHEQLTCVGAGTAEPQQRAQPKRRAAIVCTQGIVSHAAVTH